MSKTSDNACVPVCMCACVHVCLCPCVLVCLLVCLSSRSGLRTVNLVPTAKRAAVWSECWTGCATAGLHAAIFKDETERPLGRCVCARVVVLQADVVAAPNIVDRAATRHHVARSRHILFRVANIILRVADNQCSNKLRVHPRTCRLCG